MNKGIVEGMAAPVTVAEGPAACREFEVRTASGSVFVTDGRAVEDVGAIKKFVAVIKSYCVSMLILLLVTGSTSVEIEPTPETDWLGKMSVRLKMTEFELEDTVEMGGSGVCWGGSLMVKETLEGGSAVLLVDGSAGGVYGGVVSDVEFPGSKIGGTLIEIEMNGGSVGAALVELSDVDGGSVGAGVLLVDVGSSVGKGNEMDSERDKLSKGSELVDGSGEAIVGSVELLVLVLVLLSLLLVLVLVLVGSVAAGSVGAGSVAAGSVGAGSVGAGSVGAGSVAAGSVAAGSVAAGCVAAGSVAAGSLAAGSLTAGSLTTGSLTTGSVGAGSVTVIVEGGPRE